MLLRLRRDEGGMAMIVAMMVMFVVVLLGISVYAQAVHNGRQSGLDRKRLQSVDSAEAGLNYFYNCIEHTQAANVTSCAVTGSLAVAPGTSSFTIAPTWYSDTKGQNAVTGPFTDSNAPKSVKVVSTGTTNGRVTRKMESFVVLHSVFGGFTAAFIADSNLNLVNSFNIYGNNISDGDIYVTCESGQPSCNASLTSGNQTIRGNIYVVNGSLTVSTQAHIYGNAWANGAVSISHPNAIVDLNATSSTSSLSVTGGNVTGSGTYCTGTAPSSAYVHGGTVQQCQGAPPAPQFLHLTYDDSVSPDADASWLTGCSKTPVVDCYYLRTFGAAGNSGSAGCTAARSYVEGTGTGTFNGGAPGDAATGTGVPPGFSGVIVRILSTCTYNPSNNVRVNVGADLAIISNGSISFSQQSSWTGTGSTRKMYLIVPWPQTSCPTGDITVGNNTNFNSLISVGIYTPCTAHMSNQNAFYGQILGGSVDIGNNWTMNFRPVIFPGGHVSGFSEDIAYIREVA